METFKLTLKRTNEMINITKANNIDEAIEFFSKKKKLDIIDLLEIYNVRPFIHKV